MVSLRRRRVDVPNAFHKKAGLERKILMSLASRIRMFTSQKMDEWNNAPLGEKHRAKRLLPDPLLLLERRCRAERLDVLLDSSDPERKLGEAKSPARVAAEVEGRSEGLVVRTPELVGVRSEPRAAKRCQRAFVEVAKKTYLSLVSRRARKLGCLPSPKSCESGFVSESLEFRKERRTSQKSSYERA